MWTMETMPPGPKDSLSGSRKCNLSKRKNSTLVISECIGLNLEAEESVAQKRALIGAYVK